MDKFSLKAYIKNNPHVWYVLLLPVYLLLFFAVEKLVPADGDYWVSYIPLDDKIPFVPVFIIPYVCWYPLLVGVGLYLLAFDGPNFKKYMLFIMTGFYTALLFCLLVPNGQDLRPELEPDGLFTRLIAGIYAADTNTNVFPSMHVIGSIGAAIAAWRSDGLRRYFPLILVVAAAVCASTVLVKQHSILDIFGGILWCVPLYFCFFRRKRERKER